MKYGQFSEKYDISENAIMVYRNNAKKEKKDAFNAFYEDGKIKLIDEKYFLNRLKFKKRITREYETLYFILNRNLRNTDIVEMLSLGSDVPASVWSSFVQQNLFAVSDDSVFSYKVTALRWKFYRISRMVLRRLSRTTKKELNLKSLTDKLFEKEYKYIIEYYTNGKRDSQSVIAETKTKAKAEMKKIIKRKKIDLISRRAVFHFEELKCA